MKCSIYLSSLLLTLTLCLSSFAQIQHLGEPFDWSNKSISLLEIPTITTAALVMDEVRAYDAVTDQYKETPYRFGIAHEVSLNLFSEGQMTELPNGDKVWRLSINCPKAKSVNLNFSEYEIPVGGQLTVWNAERTEYIGVFNHKNNKEYNSLAVGLIHSNKVIVEYYEQARVTQQALLTIGTIVHGYRPVIDKNKDLAKGPIGTNGSCNMNVNCPDGDDWQDEKRGVALFLFDGFVCTGSLINNTNEDGTPLFLTASHCNAVSANMVFYFNHESASCVGNTGPINQTMSGATLLAVEVEVGSDYRLVELSSYIPNSYQPYYNGWDRSNSAVPLAVGIHHPSGDVKKISFDDDPITKTSYSDNTVNSGANHWRVEAWERNTTTEGGSSGSPLFDQNHRIIGQLHGGGAACGNSLSDWYGAFGNSWSGMSSFLDPLGTGATALDGLEGGATCSDGIQNQGETGIDCGGPSCAPCPCDDGSSIRVSITFDDYPEDISWTLTSGAATIATGGNYGGLPDGSTFNQEICLVDGCYVLTVLDSYGDGLCCAEGIGSWTVFDVDDNVLASETGSWENGAISSGNFCVEFVGADCSVFGTAPVDLTKSFDPVDGIQDRVQIKWFKASPQVKYSDTDVAACDIKFWEKRDLDPVTGFPIGPSIVNPDTLSLVDRKKFYPDGVTPREIFKWPVKFRKDSDAAGAKLANANKRYEWKVRCACEHGAGQESPWSAVKIFNTPDFDPVTGIYTPPVGAFNSESGIKSLVNGSETSFLIYPNPVQYEMNISFLAEANSTYLLRVLDIQGRIVISEETQVQKGENFLNFDTNNLENGTYLLYIVSEGEVITKRFVVSK